jgi:hypothetical protein
MKLQCSGYVGTHGIKKLFQTFSHYGCNPMELYRLCNSPSISFSEILDKIQKAEDRTLFSECDSIHFYRQLIKKAHLDLKDHASDFCSEYIKRYFCSELQRKGLNIVFVAHNREFTRKRVYRNLINSNQTYTITASNTNPPIFTLFFKTEMGIGKRTLDLFSRFGFIRFKDEKESSFISFRKFRKQLICQLQKK